MRLVNGPVTTQNVSSHMMIGRVTHCTGLIWANTRSQQLYWDDHDMGTDTINPISIPSYLGLS